MGVRRKAGHGVVAVAVMLLLAGPAGANPQGGQVTGGSATIGNSSPIQLDIVQSTDRAVIDWKSFNIAVGERTQFHQPAPSSWTLNRVNAPDPSTIAGYLGANGGLVLVNPSGIVFSKGSQVNVNSLIATPSNISNANFMAGQMRFDQPGNPNARIVNEGTITVAQKGLAALVAPSVANSGIIRARLGKVVLAGAETFTVDFYGDGLLNFDIGPKVTSAPTGADGRQVASLVSNTGLIDAPGGTVLLTADAVSGILENVIDSSGRINARTAAAGPGKVTIDAGDGNQARLDGTIDVSSSRAGRQGGTAIVTGGVVKLTDNARIYAQGPAGGGKVRIGGGPHGTDTTVRNAQKTVIDPGAVIDASATDNGNGGNVAVWSDGATTFNGTIYAKGGPNGGDGGWVETSGKSNLYVGPTGTVSTLAPAGNTGTWLLDPADITISTAATANGGFDGGSPTNTFTATSGQGSATLQDTTLNSALASNNVVITTGNCGSCDGAAFGAITVATGASISWSSGKSLTLNADNDIVVQTGATISGNGALALNAGLATTTGSITLNSPISVNQLTATAGSTGAINLNFAGTVVTTGGGDQIYNSAVTLGANTTLTSTGSGNITLASTVNGAFGLTANTAGTTTFGGAVGGTTALSSVSATGGTINLNGGSLKTSGDQIYTGPVSLGTDTVLTSNADGANGAITLAGQVTGGANSLTLTSGSGPQSLNGVTTTGNLALNTTGTLGISDGTYTITGGGDPYVFGPATMAGTLTFGMNTNFGAATLNGNAIFQAGSNTLNFTSTVDGSNGFLITAGNTIFGGAVGPNLSGLRVNSPLTINGGSITTTGSGLNVFNGPITLGADTTLTNTGAFNMALNAPIDGAFKLTINNPGGTSIATVGGTTPVTGLTVTGGTIDVGAVTSTGAISLTTTSGGLTLSGNLTASGQTITLDSAGAVMQTGGIITADSLAIISVGSVDLPDANAVGTLAASVTGAGNSFAFRNDSTTLTIDNAGGIFGITTNNGNIVLQTTTSGDIVINDIINANNGAFELGAAPGQIGLSSAGKITETCCGGLIGASVEAIAADTISLGVPFSFNNHIGADDVGGLPTIAGTIAMQVTGAGKDLAFVNSDASLIVGTLAVSAGSLPLPSLSGVTTNGGELDLAVQQLTFGPLQTLTLQQPVNANNGSTTLGASPGLVQLISIAGDVTQTGAGIIVAGSLYAESDAGAVNLPLANRIGANDVGGIAQIAGKVSGFSDGDFTLRNDSAGLTVDTVGCGCGGIETNAGNVTLQTTIAGNITLNEQINAPGSIVTLNSVGTVTQPNGIVTADTLTGNSVGGATLNDANLVTTFGPWSNTSSGDLSFTNAQLLTTAGTISNTVGNVNLTTTSGDLVLAQNVTGTGGFLGGVTLNSAGTINQTGGVITADTLSATSVGGATLDQANLLNAAFATNTGSGNISLTNAKILNVGTMTNNVGNIALTVNGGALIQFGAVTAAIGTVSLTTTGGGNGITQTCFLGLCGTITANALTVTSDGTVSLLQANQVAAAGGITGTVTGSGDFLFRNDNTDISISSVTTQGGRVSLSTTGSGGISTNSQGITSNGGEIDIAVSAGNTFTNGATIDSGGGNVVLLADAMALSQGTISAGTVVLGPRTISNNIALGAGGYLTQLDLNSIVSAGMVQIGYRNTDATASFTGNIDIASAITTATTGFASLDLVTGGSGIVTQSGGSITATTLGVIAGGAVTLNNVGNSIGILAGFTDDTPAGFSFTNAAALTVGSMPALQYGLTIDSTTGQVASAAMATGVGKPTNSLSGLTMAGDITLTTTGAGNGITISTPINAAGHNVTLISAGGVTETPPVISSTLNVTAVGPVSMLDDNQVGTLAALVTGAGNSFQFKNVIDLTIGTVGGLSGVTTNGGAITLQTTTSGNLILSQPVSTGSSSVSTVTLNSAGTITGSGSGTITAGTLTGTSGGDTSLVRPNAIGTLGAFTSGGEFDFKTTTALAETGPVSASGDLTLEASGALTLSGSLTASGQVGIVSDTSTITQTGGIITATTLFGASNGGTSLSGANLVTNLGTFTNGGAGGFALINAQGLTVTGAVNSGTGALGLTLSGNLVLTAGLTTGTTASLISTGTISQTGGTITAGTLTGSSVGGATLNDANLAGTFGPFSNTGSGLLSFTDAQALAMTGTVSSAGNLTLTTTSGGLTLGGNVTASGNTVTLTSAGAITQSSGIITAGTLTGGSVGGATLNDGNLVSTLGPFSNTGSGLLSFTDAQALATTGTLSSAGNLTLTTTSGDLTLGGDVTASGNTVTLTSASAITQSSGIIIADTLTGASAGGTSLTGANAIATLGNFISGGGFASGNGNLTLNDSIGLNIDGLLAVGSGNMSLNVAGSITEGTNGRISASTLTVQSSGGASLLAPGFIGNRIDTLGASTNTGSGGFALNDNSDLTVSGAINAGTGDLSLRLGSTNLRFLAPPGKLTVNAALQAGRDITLRGGELLLAATATAERDLSLTTSFASGQGNVTISANQSAGGNLLGTADGAMNLIGSFKLSAGKNLVLVSNGALTQRGTLTVAAPDVVVDTTGRNGGASQLLSDLLAAQGGGTSITNASVIKAAQFTPGNTHNPISFDTGTVNATGSVMLLFGGAGTMTGTVNVAGLGVSGSGGSADLHGSIAGNTTQTAAQQGFINPLTQDNYQFNGCAIGAATCGALPTVLPSAFSQVDILGARPSQENINATLINIFDEDPLCDLLRQVDPEAAREVCRWPGSGGSGVVVVLDASPGRGAPTEH